MAGCVPEMFNDTFVRPDHFCLELFNNVSIDLCQGHLIISAILSTTDNSSVDSSEANTVTTRMEPLTSQLCVCSVHVRYYSRPTAGIGHQGMRVRASDRCLC